jgi:hypothetical protein
VLSNNEDNLPNFDVATFLIPYDVILVRTNDPFPKPTPIALVRVTTNVDKSLTIFNATPMVVAPINLESPIMMQTFLTHSQLLEGLKCESK